MNFTNWYPLESEYIHSWISQLSNLKSVVIKTANNPSTVCVTSDSNALLEYCYRYLPVQKTHHRSASSSRIFFILKSPQKIQTPRGCDYLKRYAPNCRFNDAPLDGRTKTVLYAGVNHFGLLKSIISGISSLIATSSDRQGVHAAAFRLDNHGVLLAGGSESGKSTLCLNLLKDISKFITEDWCDLFIYKANSLIAIGVDTNMSFNIKDVPGMVKVGLFPGELSSSNVVPHGHRDKIICKIQDIHPYGVLSELIINHAFLIADVPKPTKIDEPTADWLFETICSISLHSPFCFPKNLDVDFDSKWASLRKNHRNAMEAALEIRRQRYSFASKMCDLIVRGDCTLTLIPKSLTIPVEDKVAWIRQALTMN